MALLAAMITGARAVLAQRDADAKTNEITQVRPLLDDVDVTGALVTADAPPRQAVAERPALPHSSWPGLRAPSSNQ